ncbi:sugar phosphate isomerase/epimerase family protein [Roseibium aggregatum]|uniref:sugar phosphate isomerase/epimerase family protein n=1 Tax=Roseibium aggregatum TaxID=187304 RepID=UPI003A96CCEE
MPHKLTVAHLTALDLAPPAFIDAAAKSGFEGVGLRLIRVTADTPGYPLMDQPQDLRETRTILRDTGLKVSDIEFVKITPETRIETLLRFLDVGAELGAGHVITAPYDQDLNRLAETLDAFSQAAGERGLCTVLEFFPWTCIPDLATCWRVVQMTAAKVGILVDSLHFDRSGADHALLRSLPAERLPFAHLCDAPVKPSYSTEELLVTARENRLPPGHGDIDLTRFLGSLPEDIPLALEVPMYGTVPVEDTVRKLQGIMDATQSLLAVTGETGN